MKTKRWNRAEKVFFALIIIVFILASLNVVKARGLLLPEQPEVYIDDNTITLSSLTLEQKIAQMVIVAGNPRNTPAWKNLQVGGMHLFAMQDAVLFQNTITEAQAGQSIPFFITADLEGCLNPFANFQQFTSASSITTAGQAFEKGSTEGKFLSSLGFTVNFAPVVDLQDTIWNCRSFSGNETQIAESAEAYILGLQSEKVFSTVKHYPGKTLVVQDPHKYLVAADIKAQDVYPFTYVTDKGDVTLVMVSHIITSGEIDSSGLPAVVSPAVIQGLKQHFAGVVISDEINMLGLKQYYPTLDEMYIAVFTAGNDMVLNFNDDPNEIYRMIQVVKKAVEEGVIPEEQIDASVRKIVRLKGFTIT